MKMTRKQKGEITEAEFLAIALRLGFIVSKPWGDSAPHDFLVQSPSGGLYRIQIKSCWSKTVHAYMINAGRLGNRVGYRPGEVDFIVACIDLGPLRCPNCYKLFSLAHHTVTVGKSGKGTASIRAVKHPHLLAASAAEGRRPKTENRRLLSTSAWYLIPLAALRGQKSIALFPHTPNSRSRYERYRESWHLLT
jgi:hypothetical protein